MAKVPLSGDPRVEHIMGSRCRACGKWLSGQVSSVRGLLEMQDSSTESPLDPTKQLCPECDRQRQERENSRGQQDRIDLIRWTLIGVVVAGLLLIWTR